MYKAAAVVFLIAAVWATGAVAGAVVGTYPCQQSVGETTYDLTPLKGSIFPITAYDQHYSYGCKVAFCEDNEALRGDGSGGPGTVECDLGGQPVVAAWAESSNVSSISGGISIFSPGGVVQDMGRFQTTIDLLCDEASGSTAVAVNGSSVASAPTDIYLKLAFHTALVCGSPLSSSPSPSASPSPSTSSSSAASASPVRVASGSDHSVAIAVGVAVPAASVLLLAGVGFVVVVAALWWRQPR